MGEMKPESRIDMTMLQFREYTPADRDDVIALIDRVYAEYGERLCLENADSDLLDIPAIYGAGNFIVLDDGSSLVGSVAIMDKAGTRCALKRLYLDAEHRGGIWAEQMMDWAMARARTLGNTHMELWSDTRFARAHAFYRKAGFRFDGRVRTMHDNYAPYDEYYFDIEL